MPGSQLNSKWADPNSVRSLVRRLLLEQAFGQWKRYALAFALMAVAAGATALSAYLIGNVINAAYVDKNLPGIFWLALGTAALFMMKAAATYGSSLTLARIGNRIIAQNQRARVFVLSKLGSDFFCQHPLSGHSL